MNKEELVTEISKSAKVTKKEAEAVTQVGFTNPTKIFPQL